MSAINAEISLFYLSSESRARCRRTRLRTMCSDSVTDEIKHACDLGSLLFARHFTESRTLDTVNINECTAYRSRSLPYRSRIRPIDTKRTEIYARLSRLLLVPARNFALQHSSRALARLLFHNELRPAANLSAGTTKRIIAWKPIHINNFYFLLFYLN